MSKIVVVGSYITDIAAFTSRFPKEGETIIGNNVIIGPGGKGSNQATAASRAGAEVIMITKTGNDLMRNVALEHYKKEGMTDKYVYIDDLHSTGTAIIEINETSAQNRIVVIPGANEYLSIEEIDNAESEIANCDALLVQLEANIDAVEEAIRKAKEYNKLIVLNPAPAKEIDEKLIKAADYFTPNETEAEFYTGVKVVDKDSCTKAAGILMGKGAKNVIITLGSKGVYVKTKELEIIIDAYNVKAIDTTGAGDAFNGAFTVAISEGRDILSSVKFASATAALSVTKMGTSESMPYRKEIEEFLRR